MHLSLLKPEVSLDYHTGVKSKRAFIIEGIRNEHISCSPAVLRILPPADELQPSPAETDSKYLVSLLQVAYLLIFPLQCQYHDVITTGGNCKCLQET